MRWLKRVYVAACRRWVRGGLTLSALAFKHAQDTGDRFWRNRIDGWFLLFCGEEQHCQTRFQRETKGN